ncbi:MAG TPA: hypothetical protein PK640_12340, partial [Verrucomicrobiota bacterium]|nr:hypothetical protein [Verrucomicrobiota bacterium]
DARLTQTTKQPNDLLSVSETAAGALACRTSLGFCVADGKPNKGMDRTGMGFVQTRRTSNRPMQWRHWPSRGRTGRADEANAWMMEGGVPYDAHF